ncbi:right-handed parallel beta-helix repeat-containing protein [Nitrobacteraceae bacterium UC4446_H13]
MAEGIRAPNLPLGGSPAHFLGLEMDGDKLSLRRFSRSSVLGAFDASLAGGIAGAVIFSTKAAALGSLEYPNLTMAWVALDPTPANNGVYRKAGNSGAGTWDRVADLPYSFYRAENEGAGTANAIVATNGYPMASKDALIVVNITDTNTSASVTLILNDGTPLPIKTAAGNDPAIGGFLPGMVLAGYIEGANFRLLSDQASTAIQTAAEAAQTAAEAARDVATGAMSAFLGTEFETKALAEAYSPSAAPNFIWTAFYDTDHVPGSGGTYAKDAGTDLTITLSDGVTEVNYGLAVERPIIAQYGAINTLDDIEVWRTASSKLQDGDTLAFPAGLKGTLRNATGTGATIYDQRADAVANSKLKALTCDKNGVTIVINGQVDFTSALDDGFRFTGNGVKFVGENGKITNTSGDFLADNSTDTTVQWRPSLIRLDGDECEVTGLHFLDHPTIAAWARGSRSKIHHNLFEGGPTEHQVGEYTVQFCVALAPESGGGIGSDVSYNTFRRSAANGAAYTAIFGVQPNATFGSNKIYDMLEHGIYNYGAGCSIIGNHVRDTLGNMQAAAIQNFAGSAIIEGNHLDGNNPFIALQIASDCQVRGNRGGGISVRTYHAALSSDLVENLLIAQNFLQCPTGQFWPIDIGLAQPFKKLQILGNVISGGGDSFSNQRGAMSVVVTDDAATGGQELLVEGNTVDGGASYSLLTRRVSSGLVTGNNFKDAWIGGGSDTAVRMYSSDALKFNNNHVRDSRETPVLTRILYAPTTDGNSNIEGNFNNISRPASSSNAFMVLPDAARPEGNTQDSLPLSGTFTMGNVNSQNVTHTSLRPGAKIRLYPVNKEAWALQAGSDSIYVSAISAGTFQVATKSGANAGSSAPVFDYLIVQ